MTKYYGVDGNRQRLNVTDHGSTPETIKLGYELCHNRDLANDLIKRLQDNQKPITYSGQEFDRESSLAAHFADILRRDTNF